MHIVPHMEVAIFEPRNHFFVLPIMQILKDGGKLYSVGSNENLLQKVFNEVKHLGGTLHTLKAHVGKHKGVPLKDKSLDFILLDNVLFTLEDHKEGLKEISRLLKKGGRVFVIDWLHSFGGIGPHEKHIVSKTKTNELFVLSGFNLINEIDAGDFHFAFVFRKE